MLLTEEQAKLLQQTKAPVEVTDPTTHQVYYLISAEIFEKIRDLLPVNGPPGHSSAANGEGPQCSWRNPEKRLPIPQSIRDLAVPPDVTQRLQRRCAKLNIGRGRSRQELLDQLLMQWYYGGQSVGWLPSANGKVIVAAGALDELFDAQLARLSPDERRQVVIEAAYPWDDQTSWLPRLSYDED